MNIGSYIAPTFRLCVSDSDRCPTAEVESMAAHSHYSMSKNNTFQEVKRLIKKCRRPPREQLPKGLSPQELQTLDARLGIRTPETFKDWLSISNGPCIGPGGFFGINTPRSSLNIESILNTHPTWRTNGWIPIAGDGNGDYYVLLANDTRHPVAFIDPTVSPNDLTYAVASSLPVFLELVLRKELGEIADWPFSKPITRTLDPLLLDLRNRYQMPFDRTEMKRE